MGGGVILSVCYSGFRYSEVLLYVKHLDSLTHYVLVIMDPPCPSTLWTLGGGGGGGDEHKKQSHDEHSDIQGWGGDMQACILLGHWGRGCRTFIQAPCSWSGSHFHLILQALVTQVMAATKSSNKLPQEGDDYDYYDSFPGFQAFSNKMARRVDRIISKVIRHQQLPCYWGVEDEGGVSEASQLEEKFETLIEANDVMLERAVSGAGIHILAVSPISKQTLHGNSCS